MFIATLLLVAMVIALVILLAYYDRRRIARVPIRVDRSHLPRRRR